ncbi:MAG: hypothetical protein FJ202_06030 [Gemmatimonadetes bacterium]|nr:hypothetical protein [Gemmatimonadota bacterium]
MSAPRDRWAVVLAGGVGSRFWPLSTPERPKQLLPLISAKPMLEDTLERLAPVAPLERTLVLTNASLADAVRKLVPTLPAGNVIAEPRPAGTAAALTWAANLIAKRSGGESPMVCVHADWAIGDVDLFRATLIAAADAAAANEALITVGIVPSWPDPGLGYIEPGEPVRDVSIGTSPAPLRRVARFIEKPDRVRAEALVNGGCLWNSGIFAWRAADLLTEIRAHCPEVAPALDKHGDNAEGFFAAARSIAIDHGVLERSKRVMVLPGRFPWSDVGTWAALRTVRVQDASGNAPAGAVVLRDSSANVVHAEGTTVVGYGIEGLVIVSLPGVTLVTTAERAADLKSLLEALPPDVREKIARAVESGPGRAA